MFRTAALMLGLALVLVTGGALDTPSFARTHAHPPAAAPRKVLPDYFTVPPALIVAPGTNPDIEDFGEASFYEPGSEEAITKRGKHWRVDLVYSGLTGDIRGKDVWALIKPALIAGGWKVTVEYDSNPFSAMMRYQKDGKDVWAYMKLFAKDDIRLNIVEVGGQDASFVIPPPAATPEKFSAEHGDFPYLLSLPGSKFNSGSHDGGQFVVHLADGDQVVGVSSLVKFYTPPPGNSNLSFVTNYHNALVKAGWTIVDQSQNFDQSDATLTAHYTQNGRNIWTYLHNGGSEYKIQVADAGADDLATKLAKDCHVAIYGVLFDFNKATLKPESDAVLRQILGLLQKDAALKLEIQGHTDNVGGDDYNQKLSEARAASVVGWLTGHGIAASRLTSKGYGKTRPVASNDSDEGRAKNRRVEIAKPGCAAH